MDFFEYLQEVGLSRGKSQIIASSPKSSRRLMLLGFTPETIRRVCDDVPWTYKGTTCTTEFADLRKHHLTQKKGFKKNESKEAITRAQNALRQLRKRRGEIKDVYRNIPLPGRTTGKEETLVRGPRETFQPTPSRLSDQVNVNDPIAALKQGFTEMEDFWNDLSDFEREHTDMVNFDQYINIDGPDDEEVQSETVAEDSTMEDLDDYDIEMANLFGEEPERQTKRKRESDFPEALPGDVDHDEKRRKLEIGTGSSQAPPPGLRKNGKKEKDGKFENRNLNWQANAIPANKAGREEQQSPPTDASLAILALLPMNGTFERRQVIVPFYPDFLRVGRQVSAETVPTAINGFFDSMVVSKVHASVWAEEETGKIRVKDLGSSNGTFVNGVRLSAKNQENEPHELREQDTLDLGIDVVSDDQKTIIHHRVSAKVELAGVYTKVSHDETIRGTNGGLIFLESQQHASTVSELDSIDQEASKDSSGNSAELQPSVQTEEKQSPVVTIPRTARFTDSVWIRRSLRARNGYTTKRYDEQTRPSREFRSFFATRRQRKELLRKGEKVWNEEDAAFIRTGKKFEEPGARLRAELVAKSLLDGPKTPLKKLLRQSEMSLDSRRRRGFQGPKVKELSPKEKRMTEQMKKSGLKQDEVALGYNTTKGLMLEVEEELAKWQKEEEEEEEEEERQVNHSNALLLLNKSFFAAARANWPSGAWSETE